MKRTAFEIVYDLGFTTGKIREDGFWKALRMRTGIQGADEELKEEILSRFTLRPWMLDVVSELKNKGVVVSILSDQTHWLDELDKRYHFFDVFDAVFNSYHLGITKKDPACFDQVLQQICKKPEEVLFVDDHCPHIKRAKSRGLWTLFYVDRSGFLQELKKFFPLF
jgi:putative hydrolase of the HAD superfamily